MIGEIKTRRPPKHFSLLYLQNNEVFFLSLKVGLLVDPAAEEIQGKLHLCSRSIFFEPNNIAKPLLRIKLSCGIFLRKFKNIQIKKAHKLVHFQKTQTEIKTILQKQPQLFLEMIEQEAAKNSKLKHSNLASKIYEHWRKKKVETDQKISSCIFIKVPKIFVIHRKPISPYITEKTDENYVFFLKKDNEKSKIIRFLKLYDEIYKCIDEDRLIKGIIAVTLEEAVDEIKQSHQEEKLDSSNLLKCRRVNIEGCEHGQFVLLKQKIKFYPLLNCPEEEVLEFTYREIKFLTKYRYLFQNIGIQIWLYNYPHSILFVFADHTVREIVFRHLQEKAEKIIKLELSEITVAWSNGEISNVQYLNYVNILGNRSHNDLSQYPVFPWVIHNYDLDFDLKNKQLFRDLTKPIGAINKHRLRKLKDFYQMQIKDKTSNTPARLYPTHYSTPGYVTYYLIRKIPEFIVRLQNGVFSPSDRIFREVESAYFACMNSIADFKQLIPQFYSTDCDFLVNSQKLEMGSTPQGQIIDDVVLPKWANNSQDFLLKMRAAFQSDYVSAHLNQWIDLVFGFKQSGTSAITYDNIYYYLTYQENVNFDRQMPRIERAALEVQLSEFGQTPIQLFEVKHSIKRSRILNLDIMQSVDDKKLLNAKMQALGEENERLQEEVERQGYRFTKKLKEKEEMLQRNQKEKKKDVEKIREMLAIDTESLKKFNFKQNFNTEEEKDVYIRQIEQLLKKRERQNSEMNVIVAGLKRQIANDVESVNSNIEENVKLEEDFFEEDVQ